MLIHITLQQCMKFLCLAFIDQVSSLVQILFENLPIRTKGLQEVFFRAGQLRALVLIDICFDFINEAVNFLIILVSVFLAVGQGLHVADIHSDSLI
ncbi:hypothetical protein D3C73_1319580 [compost metagenome]